MRIFRPSHICFIIVKFINFLCNITKRYSTCYNCLLKCYFIFSQKVQYILPREQLGNTYFISKYVSLSVEQYLYHILRFIITVNSATKLRYIMKLEMDIGSSSKLPIDMDF